MCIQFTQGNETLFYSFWGALEKAVLFKSLEDSDISTDLQFLPSFYQEMHNKINTFKYKDTN